MFFLRLLMAHAPQQIMKSTATVQTVRINTGIGIIGVMDRSSLICKYLLSETFHVQKCNPQ